MNDKKELQKVCCGKCDYFIAMTDREEVSLHHKELYFYFYGGLIIITCKGCGALNYICDQEYETAHPDAVASVKAMVNMQQAVFKKWLSRRSLEKGVNHV
jgi:hypothetical protein